MKNRPLKPWHQVVVLKDEIRTGALALEEFAADLHDVTLGRNRRPVYEDPNRFFALTYPTHAMRELVKDVAARLAGASTKAVRQLELTYGGGKTHTLITLYYLFKDPTSLPDLPAVREFKQHAARNLPRALPVTLCFDKIDVERGLEDIRSPSGESRRLLHPWSILAFQLAGSDGLREIHPKGKNEERDTPPAEPLLVKLIERPSANGLSTLILVDEVLMYATVKASLDRNWAKRIQTFFQYLTQAVVKVDCAAMVASILATDTQKQHGSVGGHLADDLADIFRRQREETIQPVQKEDITEVLRRRFFEASTIRDPNLYRSHVFGVVQCIKRFDRAVSKDIHKVEERFLNGFPFHPDLTDVFYSRWTQLNTFQRTRGILRTIALALRSAENWDRGPIIGPATFLSDPETSTLSEGIRELAGIATQKGNDGSSAEWLTLLQAELEKAREVQDELTILNKYREIEQAVVAVFLHSQPIGHKASTGEVTRMIGTSTSDMIEVQMGLKRWRELSWFLDDDDFEAVGAGDSETLPSFWRLGNRPNLRQMHDDACQHRVKIDSINKRLEEEIRSVKKMLVGGALATGPLTHLLPESPKDIADDGNFHYAVLGPRAVSESGRPSTFAKSFISSKDDQSTGRVNRNSLVLAVPSRDGLDAAIASVRAVLGWQVVQEQLQEHKVDPVQWQRLLRRLGDAEKKAASIVRHAYEIVVTANKEGNIQAFKLKAGYDNLFIAIKNDDRSRIRETPVDAEALLPNGPYALWKPDEQSRFVTDLTEAFARYPRLPKLLNRRVLLDTVLQGVTRGLFVGRFKRPDGTFRTWWRESITEHVQMDSALEVLLPAFAELASLSPRLLGVGELPGLWDSIGEQHTLSVSKLVSYFGGGHTVSVPKDRYHELVTLPCCSEDVLFTAIEAAVHEGVVWLKNDPSSVWKTAVPSGVLDLDAKLYPPPSRIGPQELMPDAVPDAWKDGRTNGARLENVLSRKHRVILPWGLIRDSIVSSVASGWLAIDEQSTVSASCNYDENASLWLRVPEKIPPPRPPLGSTAAVLEARQIQDLAELLPEILKVSVGAELRFLLRVELEGEPARQCREQVNEFLREVSDDLKVG